MKRPATGHRKFKRSINIGRNTSKKNASKKACRGKVVY